jgi:hypothetical protein
VKTLDVKARLDCASVAVTVLRALQTSDGEMPYREFASAIGLMSDDDAWDAWHRQQITDVLSLMAASERQSRSADIRPLQFHRIIPWDGERRPAFYQTSKVEAD